MKGAVSRIGILALIACGMTIQGCLIPYPRYLAVKRERDQLKQEVREKEGIINDDQTRIASLTSDLATQRQLVKLYEEGKLKAEDAARKAKEQIAAAQKRLDDIARKLGEGVEVTPEGTLAIKSTLLFALGSARISDKGKQVLGSLAAELKNTDEIIQIDGHTDDIPVAKPETVKLYKDNWGLSASRALNVLRFLATSGISHERMFARAFSMYRPRVPGARDDIGRSRNRRVEIGIRAPARAAAAPPQ